MKKILTLMLLLMVTASSFVVHAQSAVATVYIDRPDICELWLLNSSNNDWERVDLPNSGDVPNEITFNPETQSTWDFDPLYSYIYSLTLNGQPVDDSEYVVRGVKNGDVIRVLVEAPTSGATVTMTGATEAIASVLVNGSEAEITANTFSAALNSQVLLYPNPDYLVQTLTVNGTPLSYIVASGCYAFNVTAHTNTVAIEAVRKDLLKATFTLNIPDAQGINLFTSADAYALGSAYEGLVDGTQQITVNATAPIVQIKAADGYAVTSATYTTTQGVTENMDFITGLNYYFVNILDKDVASIAVAVEAESLEPVNVVVYCSDVTALSSYFIRTSDIKFPIDSDDADRLLVTGYTSFTMTESQNPVRLSLDFVGTVRNYVYLNDARVNGLSSNDASLWGNITLPETSVLKIYTRQAPKTHTVNFNIQGVDAETLDIKADLILPVDPSKALKCLTGTQLRISGADISVAVGAQEVEPVDGVFVVDVNSGITVDITPSSGIESVISAPSAPGKAYNLQGIEVDRSNLPAGLYIIDGRKVMVR